MLYFDYAASTPIEPRVAQKMQEILIQTEFCGNPSSNHSYGKKAHEAIQHARAQIADLIHADQNTIQNTLIFTSGATESINLAIKGVAQFYQRKKNHIVTCQTEHRAVLESCQYLASLGFEITYLKPNADGTLDIEQLIDSLRNETILVSLMHANNETGVLHDIETIGRHLREREIFFHVDAAQSIGKIPINIKESCIDLMSFSAHKIYGPKGIGALFVNDKPKVRLIPQLHGGGQERGWRSGTVPTHQCAGMGEALAIAKQAMFLENEKILNLSQKFMRELSHLPQVFLNGHPSARLPHILNICFAGIDRDQLLAKLNNNIAISASSACTGTSLDTSHVLRAMGLRNELAHRSLRISLGRFTTSTEVDSAIHLIRTAYLEGINK